MTSHSKPDACTAQDDAIAVAYDFDRVPPDARERAFWLWWLPHFARAAWVHRLTRDEALRALINAARATCSHRDIRPIDIDTMMDIAIHALDAKHLDVWSRIERAVDPMMDSRMSEASIRAKVRDVAGRAGFADLDWEGLLLDRARAWQWRRKSHKGAS